MFVGRANCFYDGDTPYIVIVVHVDPKAKQFNNFYGLICGIINQIPASPFFQFPSIQSDLLFIFKQGITFMTMYAKVICAILHGEALDGFSSLSQRKTNFQIVLKDDILRFEETRGYYE